MTDEFLLLEALRRDPGDAVAWLALADWLEESGQPRRAELSRLTRHARALAPDCTDRPVVEAAIVAMLAEGVAPCFPQITNSMGMRFVMVPSGVAWMGSSPADANHQNDEQPRHPIEYPEPFWISVYPVTQEQYAQVCDANPSTFSAEGKSATRVKGLDTSRFPVDSVSWNDSTAFCKKLSKRPQEKKASHKYRLPTEAEWEYACRACGAITTTFLTGNALTSDVANFNGTRPYAPAPEGPNLERTTEVGRYPPNALGLYDLTGNVWEWVQDWFSPAGYSAHRRVNPVGPARGRSRVLRGGSWSSYGWGCRIAYRNCIGPGAGNNNFGFRPVLELRPGK
jgi:uncharacterized protein (TIGR02996 family)